MLLDNFLVVVVVDTRHFGMNFDVLVHLAHHILPGLCFDRATLTVEHLVHSRCDYQPSFPINPTTNTGGNSLYYCARRYFPVYFPRILRVRLHSTSCITRATDPAKCPGTDYTPRFLETRQSLPFSKERFTFVLLLLRPPCIQFDVVTVSAEIIIMLLLWIECRFV